MHICRSQSILPWLSSSSPVEQSLLWLGLVEDRGFLLVLSLRSTWALCHLIQSASWPSVKPLTNAGCCLQIKLPKKLAHLLSPFFSGFPSLLLFPASSHCCAKVLSMRCLISVHISSSRGNNKSRLAISINKMYYYPSTANERKVCLAHACNSDMPGAAILLLRQSVSWHKPRQS